MTKDRINQLRAGSSIAKNKSSSIVIDDDAEETELTALTGQQSQPVIVKSKNKGKNGLETAYEHVNTINTLLARIQEDVVVLKSLHVRMQQSTRTDPSIREQIDSLNESVKAYVVKIKNALKELEKEKKGDEDKVIFRVVSTQHSLLTKRFKETLFDYENTLLTHKTICEDLIKKQLFIVIEKFLLKKIACVPADKEVTNEELNALLDAEDTAVFVDNYARETLEARRLLEDARDRHKELLVIERDIELIREMFFDIALHVTQQGELIDRIEYHIGNGCILTEKSNRKLNKAEKFMMKARKKKCWLIICLSSVIGVLLLIMCLQMLLTPG